MDELLKVLIKCALLIGIGVGAGAGLSRGCNVYYNSYETKTAKYHTVSKATGIAEHIDYTRYDDGTEEIRVKPGIVIQSEKMYFNSNKDDKVDRIRTHSPNYGVLELLVRDLDYENNKEEFDKADQLLLEYRAIADKEQNLKIEK